jgi:hypothetical protein
MNDSELLKDWLDERRTSGTRRVYESNIRAFKKWYGKSLSNFLELTPKEMRHSALIFQNEMTEKGMKPNTIINVLTALGSLCAHNDRPLLLRGKRVRHMIDLGSHTFTTSDLTKMLNVADVQGKAILTAFTSLGWEVSSVLALERVYIQNLISKAREEQKRFIYFLGQRKKTGVVRLGVLNPLAIDCIGEWFRTGWKGPYLFSYRTKEGVNGLLRHLCRDAHVTVTGRVHSHLIRKWVMSGLSRAGFNEFQIKFVLGKAIPLSDLTYLQTLQQEVEDRYPRAFDEYLDISGKIVDVKKVEALQKQLQDLKEYIQHVEREVREYRLSPYNVQKQQESTS